MNLIRYDSSDFLPSPLFCATFLLYQESDDCYEEDMRAASPHRGYRLIGIQRQLIYARSLWEANFARYLQWLQDNHKIQSWRHEPRVFYFGSIRRGCTNYKPDFYVEVSPNNGYWVEVKGYMDAQSATKIKRFRKYYPEEELRVIDGKWFAQNQPKLKLIVPNWESQDRLNILSKEEAQQIKCLI